jgi:glucose dehydrogenase
MTAPQAIGVRSMILSICTILVVLSARIGRASEVAGWPVTGLHGGPITYATPHGQKQLLVVAPGGHVALGTKLGDYIIAYTLPDSGKETSQP